MKNFGDWLTNRMSPDQNVRENQPSEMPVQQVEEILIRVGIFFQDRKSVV